jgi:hypothetical protein
VLRWALFEPAKAAARPSSPGYAYHQQVKARQGGNRATLAVAGKLARRVRHTLASLGDTALAPNRGPAHSYGGLTGMAGGCPAHRHTDVPQPAPAWPCRHGRSMDGPKRPRSRAPRGIPIDHPWPSSAHPRTRHTAPPRDQGPANSPASALVTSIRRPFRLPEVTWTAWSLPDWTHCRMVWRERPSRAAASANYFPRING